MELRRKSKPLAAAASLISVLFAFFVLLSRSSADDPETGKAQAEGGKYVATIKKVEWVGYDPGDGHSNYEAGGNPANRGGGDRIFAERNQPEGRTHDDLHHQIKVKVTLTSAPPTGMNVSIFLKLFDPDHYSTDADFDTNGNSPDDNVTVGGTQNIGASLQHDNFTDFSSSTAPFGTIEGDGTKDSFTIGVEITARQPGNNYIVAAATSVAAVNAFVFKNDGKTLLEKTGGAALAASAQSPMLTVWRTLYAELDHMGDPNYGLGAAPSRITAGNVTFAGKVLTTNQTISATGANQFKGGKIELFNGATPAVSLGKYDVDGNTTGANSQVTLTVNVPAGTATFKNLEDDDIAHGITAADMATDTSFWESRYDPACVKTNFTKTDLCKDNTSSVNQNDVAFQTNIGETVGETGSDAAEKTADRTIVKANKQSTSSTDFWVIYQLGAFQGEVKEDADPNSELGTCGVSSQWSEPANDTEAGTIIYAETMKDVTLTDVRYTISLANFRKANSVHESGHEWAMEDGPDDGKIMDASTGCAANTDAKVNALIFSGKGLRKIMNKDFPGKN